MGAIELRWGLIIGGANLGWLYGSYYMGMQTSGLGMIQIMTLVSVVISIIGYVCALRAIVKAEPEITCLEGVKSGAIVVGVVTVVAVLAQVGYHKLVFPGFTKYMVGETEIFYRNNGLPAEQVIEMAEGAGKTFGLASYAMQSALGALIIGMITVTIVMAILRRRRYP
mgnify:CR=1 FL=1|tara:strand:- start:200 stop:703 length:504 start_codon:yes stop_codon:yes gene_type:complete